MSALRSSERLQSGAVGVVVRCRSEAYFLNSDDRDVGEDERGVNKEVDEKGEYCPRRGSVKRRYIVRGRQQEAAESSNFLKQMRDHCWIFNAALFRILMLMHSKTMTLQIN